MVIFNIVKLYGHGKQDFKAGIWSCKKNVFSTEIIWEKQYKMFCFLHSSSYDGHPCSISFKLLELNSIS